MTYQEIPAAKPLLFQPGHIYNKNLAALRSLREANQQIIESRP